MKEKFVGILLLGADLARGHSEFAEIPGRQLNTLAGFNPDVDWHLGRSGILDELGNPLLFCLVDLSQSCSEGHTFHASLLVSNQNINCHRVQNKSRTSIHINFSLSYPQKGPFWPKKGILIEETGI
jgi:hypothetical protein